MKPKTKRQLFYFGLLAPGLIITLFIIAYPTLLTIIYSFTNLHLIFPIRTFIGLENYQEILSPGSLFFLALFNGTFYTVLTVFLQFLLGLSLALALQKIKKGVSFFRLILIVPWTFPDVSLAFGWRWMLEPTVGIINFFLLKIGFINQPIGWFGSPERAMYSVIIMSVWFGFPYMMISLIAGLQAIPKALYEAASIDGATAIKSFFYITLPSLKKITLITLLLRSLWLFNNFSFFFLTTGGGPGDKTEVLPLMIYKMGWKEQLLGKASSVAVLSLIILMVFSIFVLKYTEEEVE